MQQLLLLLLLLLLLIIIIIIIIIIILIALIKAYYKTEVGTWRFREALKKLMHDNANTAFIVICLIYIFYIILYFSLCASLSICVI